MPIIGLTDREEGFGSGLPLIGRLHKGAPKEEVTRQNGTTYTKFGKDLEYFRVTFEPGYEWLESTWVEMYSENPDWFNNVFLCGDTVDEAFPTWNEEWNAQGAMLHKCDGENQVAQWNGSMYITAKVSCIKGRDATGKQTGCGCKQTGRLMIAIPEFIEATGVFGQFMVTTHSINDIVAVYKILKGIEKKIGRVSGIPFSFGRAPQEISAPKQEKINGSYQVNGRVNVTKSLFVLYPDPTYTREILLPQMTQIALPAPKTEIAPAQPVDIEVVKRTLGSGSIRMVGRDTPPASLTSGSSALQPAPETQPDATPPPEPEQKKVGDWATPENLDLVFSKVRGQLGMPDLTDRELAALVGIKESDVRSKVIWDAAFLTGAAAGISMVEAFNTPKDPPAITPPMKTSAIVTRAMYQTAIDGKQRRAHFIFDVEGMAKKPRVYSRENVKTLLKASAGEVAGMEYYNANPFESMHSLHNVTHEIAKLEIEWETQGKVDDQGNDNTYLVVTRATPVIEKPTDDVTEIVFPMSDEASKAEFN